MNNQAQESALSDSEMVRMMNDFLNTALARAMRAEATIEQLRSILKDAHVELDSILNHNTIRPGVFNLLRALERKLITMQVARITDSEGHEFATNNTDPKHLESLKAKGHKVEIVEMSEAAYQAIPATMDAQEFFGLSYRNARDAGTQNADERGSLPT